MTQSLNRSKPNPLRYTDFDVNKDILHKEFFLNELNILVCLIFSEKFRMGVKLDLL